MGIWRLPVGHIVEIIKVIKSKVSCCSFPPHHYNIWRPWYRILSWGVVGEPTNVHGLFDQRILEMSGDLSAEEDVF